MKISHNLTNHAKKAEVRNLDSFIYELVCNNDTSAIKKKFELRLWLTKMSPKIKEKNTLWNSDFSTFFVPRNTFFNLKLWRNSKRDF